MKARNSIGYLLYRGFILITILMSLLGTNTHAASAQPLNVPPGNDDFASATLITIPSNTPYTDTIVGAASNATPQASDPPVGDPTISCLNTPGLATVWYKYVAPAEGIVTVNTATSGYDTVVAVWEGTALGSLKEASCNDDWNASFQSYSKAHVYSGKTYYIEAALIGGTGKTGFDVGVQATNDLVISINFSATNGGILDDTNVGWTYTGSWSTYNGGGPYNSTNHYSTVINSYAEITFTGTSFSLYYAKGSNRGQMDVYVDNVLKYSINAYDPVSSTWQAKATVQGLSLSSHLIKIIHTGGTYIDVDAIEIVAEYAPVPTGIYDDPSNNWLYSGAWFTYAAPGPYNNTNHYTSSVGSYAQINIEGIGFKLTYAVSSNRGSIQVWVDGMLFDTINAYNASTSAWQVTWSSQSKINLSPGVHTVKFLKANGAGSYMDIDAIQVIPPPQKVGIGTFDDTHTAWNYSSNWTLYNGVGPANNTSHYTGVPGSYTEITFDGNRFVVKYAVGTNRSLIKVTIDNVPVTTINAYNATAQWQASYDSGVLIGSTHTVRFTHAGTSNYIDVDSIQIFGPPDSTPPGAISTLSATAGAVGAATLNWTAVGDDGNTGTASSYLVRYSTSAITSGNWGSATPVTSGIPIPKAAGNAETMTVTGLMPGVTYYFAVAAQDEQPNTGGVSNSPSATIALPTPMGPGTYDDNHSAWIYGSGWTLYNGSGPYSSTNHYANAPGSYADFVFTGSQFKFRYATATNRGQTDVYVDGVKLTPSPAINGYSTTTAWQVIYTSPVYTNTTHSVRFQNIGGGYSDVDAIEVIGPPDLVAPGTITDLGATTGAGNGAVNLTWTAVGDDGATGTAASYLVRYSLSPISSGNWSSATPVSSTIIPTPKPAGNAETMTVTGLMPGLTYYFAVVAQDEQPNLGGVSNSPSAATILPAAQGAGTYDDTHASWIYSSGWTLYSGTGPFNNTNHYANTPGNYADFVFTGTKFTFKYATGTNRGQTDVYVDGVKITPSPQINGNSATTAWQVVYTSPTFTSGTHSVRFQNIGGGYSDVDSITIQ